jgi:hypothetical protein
MKLKNLWHPMLKEKAQASRPPVSLPGKTGTRPGPVHLLAEQNICQQAGQGRNSQIECVFKHYKAGPQKSKFFSKEV